MPIDTVKNHENCICNHSFKSLHLFSFDNWVQCDVQRSQISCVPSPYHMCVCVCVSHAEMHRILGLLHTLTLNFEAISISKLMHINFHDFQLFHNSFKIFHRKFISLLLAFMLTEAYNRREKRCFVRTSICLEDWRIGCILCVLIFPNTITNIHSSCMHAKLEWFY